VRLPYGTVFIHVHMRTSMGLVWSVEIQIAPAGRIAYVSIWLRESGSGCGRAGSLFGRQWISMGETSGRGSTSPCPDNMHMHDARLRKAYLIILPDYNNNTITRSYDSLLLLQLPNQ